MLYTYTLPIVFGFFILAVILRAAIPKGKVLYSIPALLVMAVFYFGTIYVLTPKTKRFRLAIPRTPQSEVYIDIVDVRGTKDEIQIIIHNGACIDRLNLKREALKNKEKLNQAVEKILDLREATGGC